jgi:transcriptional regulator with XRE-family HTH domain
MIDHDAIKKATFEHFHTNIRTLRLAAGLTLKKAAEHAGMHQRQWQKIEAGQINVTLLTLVRVAQVLGVDAAALIGDRQHLVN